LKVAPSVRPVPKLDAARGSGQMLSGYWGAREHRMAPLSMHVPHRSNHQRQTDRQVIFCISVRDLRRLRQSRNGPSKTSFARPSRDRWYPTHAVAWFYSQTSPWTTWHPIALSGIDSRHEWYMPSMTSSLDSYVQLPCRERERTQSANRSKS